MAEEKTRYQNTESPVRLPRYFYIVNVTSYLSAIFFFFLVLLFPDYTDFVTDRQLFLTLMLSLAFLDGVFLYFSTRLARTQYFIAVYMKNIMWALFLTGVFYALGGVKNYFTFAYVFPIIGTGFNLDARATLVLGIIVEVCFILLALFDGRFPHDESYYIVSISQIIFFAIFTFYLYSIIAEGIRQRFEKEKARKKYFDLIEVDKAKTEFITVVSHRLLTPLAELRWAFERVFEVKKWNKDTVSILGKSKESINALIDIVRELIHAADLEKEGVKYQRVPVDIAEVVRKIVRDLGDYSAEHDTKVKAYFGQKEFIVPCDPERITNALLDVIENAVRYSPGGTVDITVREEHGGAKIEIADTGVGIPYQEQARIFTKFFRASNASKIEPNATGVGLFIAKSIIEKHNGSIDFVSEPGKGTAFTIFLPGLVRESNPAETKATS